MTRMLVLSDTLNVDQDWLDTVMKRNVDVSHWSSYPNIPRLSDYEIVVLDMNIPRPSQVEGAFLGIRDEVRILLESSGVIVCLNHFTRHTKKETLHNKEETGLNGSSVVSSGGDWRREMNYDWMFHLYLISVTNLAHRNAKIGKSFRLMSKDKKFVEYFKGVNVYHKTIDGIAEKKDKQGNFMGYEIYVPNWGDFEVKIIAETRVSKKPIACSMRDSYGSFLFLPQSQAKPETIIEQLYEIGKSEFEANIQRLEEIPSSPKWLEEYKTKQELDLEKGIGKLAKKLEQRKLEHKRFEKIDVLLYGTGASLELAVQKALEEMGCIVEKQEKGATIDFKARIKSMKFAIEVTGVDDKINKDSKKFAQILQYLPHKEKNEKIVLLTNTYRNMDVKDRAKRENFTNTVAKIAKDNEFCLMTTKDLYFMWENFLNGEDAKKMLAAVFTAKAEFTYKG